MRKLTEFSLREQANRATPARMSTPLLPSGLPDRIHDEAECAYASNHTLMSCFMQAGFAIANPPLMEHVSALEAYCCAETLSESFRLMDPSSGELMAVRADITPQITRLASTTLAKLPRPLKLSYSGHVVRVQPDGLRTRRQSQQVGIELFGAQAQSEAEVLSTITQGLSALGLDKLTLSISLSGAMHRMLKTLDKKARSAALSAIEMHDMQALKATSPALTDMLDAPYALESAEHAQLEDFINAAREIACISNVSIDPLDASYSDYFTGMGFALYAQDHACEIGRGGRYTTPSGEEAVGFTLYIEDVLPLLSK